MCVPFVQHISHRLSALQISIIIIILVNRKEFTEFCMQLHDAVPNLRLWAAGVKCPDPLPPWLQVEKLTLPIRCPPAVHREVAQSGSIGTSVPSYDSLPTPSATDGPEVIWRQHTGQADHSEGPPRHCRRCGEVIAEVLKDRLHVGASGIGL